jgi:hypothetical protein
MRNPYLSLPCMQATSEMALWAFQRWPSCRVGRLLPSSTPLDTARGKLMAFTPFIPKTSFNPGFNEPHEKHLINILIQRTT